jgi:(1->4)-alpha-D-glucan 1-alpha-D-glucosylmutase
MIPRATYRLQFHKSFGFRDAAKLAPYLARLGISHVYASPYLKARPGSTHGYDIVDHQSLNAELGDDAAFKEMVDAFRSNGLSQILDFVPNHMGVGGADNPLWLSVLEWGRDSEHAGWFDIDWDTDRRYLQDKLLVPILGDQYGVELDAGKIALKFDPALGEFAVWAYDSHKLPICPRDYCHILGDAHPELEKFGDCFSNLDEWRPQIVRRANELKHSLAALAKADDSVAAAIEHAVTRFRTPSDDSESARPLHDLIQMQHWRVAHFRVAADDINYRRFFNINDLAGLRVELPEVFEQAHALVFKLLREGTIDGLRIDHVDGLLDVKGYLQRLRATALELAPHKPNVSWYLVVEKILASHERLRGDWPIHGTTGYDFANLVLGVLVDPSGETQLTQAYSSFTNERSRFPDIVRTSKIRIMEHEMASELNVLAREAGRVARQNPRTADFTRNILRRAIREIVACFAVYRTYVDSSGVLAADDERELDEAIRRARARETDVDASVFDFLEKLMSGKLVSEPRSGFSRNSVLRCAMKLQQYSGPVMAKGLEDTAFYRYNRFVALNEVGGHPEHFGTSIEDFHAANAARARDWPHAMLATSTHDTKRGEDTRARLAVISELSDDWVKAVTTWSESLRAGIGEDTAPHRNDEYLFYQLLAGSWPVEFTGGVVPDPQALTTYRERLEGAMTKAVREAKVHSTWATPNTAYEDGVIAFVRRALDSSSSSAFMSLFVPFADKIARLGADNSVVQATLKFTVPGMPDTYQGTELWDLSLVDPDNRRPVDYERRQQLLQEVIEALQGDRAGSMRKYREAWRDGRIKLAVTAGLLALRKEWPELFSTGTYTPCAIEGRAADDLCAFIRSHRSTTLLVAVRRFPARHRDARDLAQTKIAIPNELHNRSWRDRLSGTEHRAASVLTADALFAVLPVAVLVAQT